MMLMMLMMSKNRCCFNKEDADNPMDFGFVLLRKSVLTFSTFVPRKDGFQDLTDVVRFHQVEASKFYPLGGLMQLQIPIWNPKRL